MLQIAQEQIAQEQWELAPAPVLAQALAQVLALLQLVLAELLQLVLAELLQLVLPRVWRTMRMLHHQ